MQEADHIQACRIGDDYSKVQLIEAIEGMTQSEFNRFCKQIEMLRYVYTISLGAWATFDKDIIEPNKAKMFPLTDVMQGEFELPFDRSV